MIDTLIKNGLVVSDGAAFHGAVGIQDGKVAGLWAGRHELPSAKEVVDAAGRIVMPGGVDVHFHTRTGVGFGNTRSDDMETAGVTAAHGGISTIIPFVWGDPEQPLEEFLSAFFELADKLAVVDYSAHCGLRPDMSQIAQVPDAVGLGVTSFKMHYDYRKTGHGRMSDDDHRLAAMEIVGRHGGLAMVHAENGYIIDYLENKYIEAGTATKENFLASRPSLAEAEAVHRTIVLGEIADCPVYICHLSSELGLEEIVSAQSKGRPVATETCPQYLCLTNDALDAWGVLAKIGPPLRRAPDLAAMWRGLKAGHIESVGSDHSAYTLEWKNREVDNFFLAQFGTSVVELMMPLVYSEGVSKGYITVEQFVSAFTESPARRFGLYPRKGTLQPGADGDVLIWDPEARWKVQADTLVNPSGYSIFDGWEIQGRPVQSWLRGMPLLKDGTVKAVPGQGELVRRR